MQFYRTTGDTALYPDGDGFYGAEWGGVSILVDTGKREIRVFVSPEDATEDDFNQAEAALTAIGAVGLPARVDSDRDVLVSTLNF